jgi:hypothetical protein
MYIANVMNWPVYMAIAKFKRGGAQRKTWRATYYYVAPTPPVPSGRIDVAYQ